MTSLVLRAIGKVRRLSKKAWLNFRLFFIINALRQKRKALHTPQGTRELIGIALIERMGDIAASEPIARHVRQLHPDAHILWLVRPTFRELVEHHPDLDGILLMSVLGEVIRLDRASVFDRLYMLHLEEQICPCFLDVVRKPDLPCITTRDYYHHGTLLEVFSQRSGLGKISTSPQLHIPDSTKKRVDTLDLPTDCMVFNCSSAEGLRDWPPDRFAELASRISSEMGHPVVEVGSQSMLKKSFCTHYIDLCGRLSILESAEVIARARLFVGIDSGPAHLAHSVGTPAVILLGHLDVYKQYMPYCGRYSDPNIARIIRAEGHVNELSVNQVFAEIKGHPALQRASEYTK